MKHKNRSNFQKKTLRLKDNHTWKAPDGFKIVVVDRGAASFNIPASWHVVKLEPLELNDQLPPNDNARVSVSLWHLPPGVDWTGLPQAKLLRDITKDKQIQPLERGPVIHAERTDLDIVWTEHRFMDPKEQREAYSRFLLARGWDVQVLISSDFWVDDSGWMYPIWDEIVRSLQLGRKIEDPTKGIALH